MSCCIHEELEIYLRRLLNNLLARVRSIADFPCTCKEGVRCQTCLAKEALEITAVHRSPFGSSTAQSAEKTGADTPDRHGSQKTNDGEM